MVENKGLARRQILDTASRLFYREGFRAVGVDTIVEQSGVAKMTLYRYFPSKDDLIVAYLEESNKNFWEWFEGAIEKEVGSPRQQLVALFDAVGVLATSPTCYGCTFQSTAAEFPELDHPGHRVALAHKQAVHDRFKALAVQAGAQQPEILADQLLLLMDGAFVATRMYGVNNPAAQVGQAAKVLIEAQLD
jgi:AcrR family transcriptional regulator